ncbi:hypothetical protein BH24DEI2_BH24DEI2_10340 [soil metagenome]
MTNSRKMLVLIALLVSFLGACSQPKLPATTPPDAMVAVDLAIVELDSANVKSVQLAVSGPEFDQAYVQDVADGAVSFSPVTLTYGDFTFTARGFSGAADRGVTTGVTR